MKTEVSEFQSLDWVERLSDFEMIKQQVKDQLFQSLDWVERLSDFVGFGAGVVFFGFQSLDWVERLSDGACDAPT